MASQHYPVSTQPALHSEFPNLSHHCPMYQIVTRIRSGQCGSNSLQSLQPAAKALKEKSQQWILALQLGFLPRHMMWTTLKCVTWPSLQYPLSVTMLMGGQLHPATAWLFQSIIPKLGTNHNYPMAPWFSLPLHQGLGLPNPEWEQGIMAIKLFIIHANALHVELITASLEYTLLNSVESPLGGQKHFLALPNTIC